MSTRQVLGLPQVRGGTHVSWREVVGVPPGLFEPWTTLINRPSCRERGGPEFEGGQRPGTTDGRQYEDTWSARARWVG